MSETEAIDFSKYEWEEKLPSRFSYYYYRFHRFLMVQIAGMGDMFAPIGYFAPTYVNLARSFDMKTVSGTLKITKLYQKVYLGEVARSLDIDDAKSYARLQYHWKRLQQYYRITFPISIITGFLAVGVFMFLSIEGLFLATRDVPDSIPLWLVLISLWMLYAFIQISRRLVAAVVHKYYADTLTTVSALYFMVDLLRRDVLEQVSGRKQLQGRLNQLAHNVLLLASQYKSNSLEDQQWIHSHFNGMTRYVREHERLIVAPKADSLEVMRRDFYSLLKILINGQYGEFSYEYAQQSNLPEQTTADKVTRVILGFIGIVIPTLLLYFILFTEQQERINKIGLDEKTVTLIALAWFLLTLDATLKLGIVERITGLAKSIRDLG